MTTEGRDLDLMPPDFSEGLDDWSRGHGTPETPTYDGAPNVRLARNDADFGACLELRKIDEVQRLRYMGEVPIGRGAFINISARVKALRGPVPVVRIAAWPGGAFGLGVEELPQTGREIELGAHGIVHDISAVIGPEAMAGVDLVWDARALYAHVGLDIIGPANGVVRIESVRVLDVSDRFCRRVAPLPGFEPANAAHPPGE